MVWCGYHPKLGDGIKSFGDGLAESIRQKAQSANVSLAVQIAEEQDQLYFLEKLLSDKLANKDASDTATTRARAILGLVSLSRFLIGQNDDPPNDLHTFIDSIEQRSLTAAKLIEELDSNFERLSTSSQSHYAKLSAALKSAGII